MGAHELHPVARTVSACSWAEQLAALEAALAGTTTRLKEREAERARTLLKQEQAQ